MCIVEYFGEQVPCSRGFNNKNCAPDYLRPGQYIAPTDDPDYLSHSIFINHENDDPAGFRFDYNRGKIVQGARGEYDLSKGFFTCFDQKEDSAN